MNSSNIDSADNKRGLFSHKLYGRRQGRSLSEQRQYAIDNILPKIKLPEDKLTLDHTIPPQDFFKQKHNEYWLEIGFGHGEHIARLMQQNPNTGYIGAEPFVNGMANFLHDIKHEPLDNIRVLMDDGMIIARSIAPNSLDGIYVLTPDPWHKTRHHKRRIINQNNLDIFAHILKPNAQLIMSTDVEDLAEWMVTQTYNHPSFTWTAQSKSDWQTPPKNWITTKYETKGAKNAKQMVYLFFERN